MAVNMGQIQVNNRKDGDQRIDVGVNAETYFRPEAVIGHNLEKQKQKISIHKEILRVSTETSIV